MSLSLLWEPTVTTAVSACPEVDDRSFVSAVNTPSLNQWVRASDLQKGEHLKTANGVIAVADGGTTPKAHDGWMWDLTVPGNNDHDFYVVPTQADSDGGYPASTDDEAAVLVHNANVPCGVTAYQVGTYRDLKAASNPVDGLYIHHVPQGQPAAQAIPWYE